MTETRTPLYPLDAFYARLGWDLPELEILPGEAVPAPYAALLVHDRDMTPTLEAHYGEKIHLHVLERHMEGESLCRQVVLTTDLTQRPAEFGAIVIHCARFPREAREKILESHCPLGTILGDYRIRHESRPRAYFRVRSDATMEGALGLDGSRFLYGRRNVLAAPGGLALAEVVEILPP